jgi:hypothetical protein
MSGTGRQLAEAIEWATKHEFAVVMICGCFIVLLTVGLIAFEEYRENKKNNKK